MIPLLYWLYHEQPHPSDDAAGTIGAGVAGLPFSIVVNNEIVTPIRHGASSACFVPPFFLAALYRGGRGQQETREPILMEHLTIGS